MAQTSVLIYASRHCVTNPQVFDTILVKSRRNNVADQITGALVIGETYFLQMLEGERSLVGACFMRIMQDCRHTGIQVVSSYETVDRLFGQWSMHRIDIEAIRPDVLTRYVPGTRFDPSHLSQPMIDDLFRTLALSERQRETPELWMEDPAVPSRLPPAVNKPA